MLRIRAEKDFWAGMLYMLLAAAFLWFGRNYPLGSAARMGSGYFPIVLGFLLFALGAMSFVRAFVVDGAAIGGLAWRKLALISLGIVVFGILLPRAGLLFALPALVLISAAASRETRYDLKAVLALAGLTVFCILVFVKGLGLPMPILGAWFDGLVPPTWQR